MLEYDSKMGIISPAESYVQNLFAEGRILTVKNLYAKKIHVPAPI